jgi:signal transduction histidine kinase
MTLRTRSLALAALLALAATVVIYSTVTWLDARDRMGALERVAAAQMTELVRDSCQADPQWFLAGPRTGRPSLEERQQPDAEVRVARPSADPLPFEFFAYDEQFRPTSTAGPRFPADFTAAMRAVQPARVVEGAFSDAGGSGIQVARLTGWTPGPCAVLLFRQRTPAGQAWTHLLLFGGLFVVTFAVAMLAVAPTESRVRRLAAAARQSARNEYSIMAPVKGQDEISALGAIFNQAAADIRRYATDTQDREEALRRYVANTTEDIAEPLAALEKHLASLERDRDATPQVREEVRRAIRESHHLFSRLNNYAAVTKLRASAERSVREPVDVNALVERVVASRSTLARASDVELHLSSPAEHVTFDADETLLAQAFANVIDNAIQYNRPGGKVEVALAAYPRDHKFSLRVTDTGRGVSDEEFAGLTANKRFRGDEARSRRPGERGLGLAITREVADRFGLRLELHRPAGGGFEAEIA